MLKLMDSILHQMKVCFKRKETFLWFLVLIIGLMVRPDYKGVTSIIGVLGLETGYYESLIHFFRSKAYDLGYLKHRWVQVIMSHIEPEILNDRSILIGDHIKVSKEARYMPSVKKHHQESENNGKSEYIMGHQYGMVGILVKGSPKQCIPMNIEIHNGAVTEDSFKPTENESVIECEKENSIEKIIRMAQGVQETSKKKAVLLLDAFFMSGKAFMLVANKHLSSIYQELVLIIKAKSNTVGYFEPEKTENKRRGRPRKYGDKIILRELFDDKSFDEEYTKVKLNLYGKLEEIQYMCVDLIWKPFGDLIRFVLVKSEKGNMILACSDLSMHAEVIIQAYSYRFKIEVSFKHLKHVIGAFFYHFWTTAMPRISRWKNQTDLCTITDKRERERILFTFRAIEVFSFVSCMALGMITILATKFPTTIWKMYTGFLRTKKTEIPSPDVVKHVLQYNLPKIYCKFSKYATLAIIMKLKKRKSELPDEVWNDAA